MKRILFLCALAIGLASATASAQTVTLGGASGVAASNDFATNVFQDPWDMNERTDVGWWLNSVDFPLPGFSAATFTSGIFSGTVTADPNLWLLETGAPNLPAIGKNGNTYAINADVYRTFAVRMRVGSPGYMLFLWSTRTIYDAPGIQTAGTVPTTAGWRIYFVDLANLPLLSGTEPWAGTKRSLRFDPAPDDAPSGSTIDIDWMRLVDNQPALTRNVSWSGFGGNVDIYLDNDNTSTTDPNQTLGLLAQNVAGSSYTLNAGALPAGTYYLAIRDSGTGNAFTYSSAAYQVNGTATVTVTSPSEEGSADDFATVQLGNAWDMTSTSDIDTTLNITNPGISTVAGAETEAGVGLGNITAFTGTSTTGEFNQQPCASFAKPVVYPLDPSKRGASVQIDPNRYRILTMEIGQPNRPRDLCGGSIVRIGWQVVGAPDWTSSWGIPLNSRAGANVLDRINFDVAAIPVDQASAALAPWTSGAIKGFRIDPHEFPNPAAFFLKRVKLAAFERTGTSYTVRWTSSKAGGAVRVYYDTDRDPGTKTLIGSTAAQSTEGSLVWSTASLPQGAVYYVYVEFDDGINTNGAYAKWPVFIDHNVSDTPPPAPAGLTARAVSASAISLSWTASPGASSYRIKRGSTPGSETVIATGVTGTSFVDAGRPPGGYYYVVTAVSGNFESGPSNEVFVRLTTAGVRGDFDADGRTDLTVFRPSTGGWFISSSSLGYSTSSYNAYTWGLTGDLPISGDVDGDHQSDLTVFRPSTSQWLIRFSSQGFNEGAAATYQWGLTGDVPLAADFDGDGRLDLTVYRPASGQWFIRYSSQAYSEAASGSYQWGVPGDRPLAADFDGDGRTDLTIFRPSTGEWLVRYSSQGYSGAAPAQFQWGLLADVPLVTDFDGDGRTDLTVYRPSTGEWFVRYSTLGYSSGAIATYQWGLPGDTAVVLDMDGDARTDLTVYRPATGEWFVRSSSTNYNGAAARTVQFGLLGDVPLPRAFDPVVHEGDFEGDGKADLTVYRPGNGSWYVSQSGTGYDPTRLLQFQWGLSGDEPLARDFDGDRRPDLAVFRPSTAEWFIRYSTRGYSEAASSYVQWGLSGDVPIAADLDGDGRAEIIVFRPSSGEWFTLYSTRGYNTASYGYVQWGLPGDIPLTADLDGDSLAEIIVFRPSSGNWFVLYSRQGYSAAAAGTFQWGLSGDIPVTGDFDGDGRSELTVYRPSTGRWLVRFSSSSYGASADYQWGLSGDVPLVRDFDGDGRAELTVYRPSTGEWFVSYSLYGYGAGSQRFQWGLTGDTPVPR